MTKRYEFYKNRQELFYFDCFRYVLVIKQNSIKALSRLPWALYIELKREWTTFSFLGMLSKKEHNTYT